MTSDQIYDRLKDIIKVYLPEDVSEAEINENSHLVKELNINSAHLIDVVLDVEDAFDITIKDDELEQLDTISRAVEIIAQKINS